MEWCSSELVRCHYVVTIRHDDYSDDHSEDKCTHNSLASLIEFLILVTLAAGEAGLAPDSTFTCDCRGAALDLRQLKLTGERKKHNNYFFINCVLVRLIDLETKGAPQSLVTPSLCWHFTVCSKGLVFWLQSVHMRSQASGAQLMG